MDEKTSQPPPDPDAPVHPPREPEDVRRHLLFGLAMALAFGSMFAGLFGGHGLIQYSLAGTALIVVLWALVSGAPKFPR